MQQARLIGKEGSRTFSCWCCDWSRGKRAQKAIEDRQWRHEAWLDSLEHDGKPCPYSDHGCFECWDFDDDWNDNSDLDDIPGVWCDMDWRNTYQDWELELLEIPKPTKRGPLG